VTTNPEFPLEDVKLKGKVISLKPLKIKHRTKLLTAAGDGELWNLWYTSVPNSDTIENYLDNAWVEKNRGTSLPFVVKHRGDKKIIGTTRFMNIDSDNKRLEIGHTWYSKSYQRTAVNTECKLLLLTHAFETLNCIAVEFRTHIANEASRNAIKRIGAKQDGILRNHRILSDGSYRDTVVFSIIAKEWPELKKELQTKLNKKSSSDILE